MDRIKMTDEQIMKMNDIDRRLTDARCAVMAAHFLPNHLKTYLANELRAMRTFLGDLTDV